MASSIVKSVAQQLGNLLVEEAKYLYSVRDKIESLQSELEWAECFLRDADTQQHQDRIVFKWVSQVRDFAYDGEDLIEVYLHGISHRHHRQDGIRNTLKWFSYILWTCDPLTLHNLGSKIDKLALKMSELTSRLQRYGIQIIRPTRSLEYNYTIKEERRTYSHTEEDVVGLKKDIEEVVDQLLKPNVKVVEISGTGGLGKTTLARKVFKHERIKGHFHDNCAWVCISTEFENKTIFQDILRHLEKENDTANKTTEQLAEEIHKVLQEKQCLVVVDDIWTVKAWERLKPAFESIFTTALWSSSSKILLTTRTKDLVQHVDPISVHLHPLKTLSDDDGWKLLKLKASRGVHGSSDEGGMEKLGKEMLKHCGGLPIAIIALGAILSTKKTLLEWEDVQKNISSYLMGSMEAETTNNNPVLKILELSYNELPYYLKPCFLYLGNFPEDYEISSHKLYHLWEAEGFLVDDEAKKKGGTSYDIGERYLNGLVQRSMVLVRKCWPSGRIRTCQVHDVIRDMCLRKCEEVGFLSHIECTKSGMVHGLPPFSTEIKKLRRCALMGEDMFEEKWQFGEKAIGLRSLLVFNKRFTPGREIWESCPFLRVLDLEGTCGYYRPYGMKCLIHLRYLSLRGLPLEEIPSCLCDLQYVETLDLRGHYEQMKSFQNSTFYKMKRLRHLYLPQKFRVKGGKKLQFPLDDQMETIKNFDPESCETEDLLQMTNLRVFSIRRGYYFKKAEELKRVLEAPVIKKAGQLINILHLQIDGDVIKEDPAILSPVEGRSESIHISVKDTEKTASSIVKSAAQNLGNLVVEEAKYLYKLRHKIESLQTELEWTECFVTDADTQHHHDETFRKWVSQVRDFAYDVEDLIERYLHEVPLHRRDSIQNTLESFSCILWTCSAWTLHNLGSEIDNLTLKMSELTSRLQRYDIEILRSIESLKYTREERRTYFPIDEDVVGLMNDMQKVVNRLVNNTEVKVVGISGTGGLGKTTLARKVFKHRNIKDHFSDNCAWVHISREFDKKTIFQEILRQLEKGYDIANKTIEELAGEINKCLQERRCLVVVDDIWTETAWKNLKPAFQSVFTTASYSKILLTTRNQGLIQHVDQPGYLHLLKPLSEDDSWELLKRKAFIGVHGSSDEDGKKKLGKLILQHCHGLPITIIAIGGILSTKETLSEWEDVLKNISSYLGMEANITNNRLLQILELSYDELPYYLKPCFLYLGNFPEDYEISSHKLYHLWEAEGFFVVDDEAKKKGGTSYDIGERYLNGLVQRSMVLVIKRWPSGRIKTCQVHDVIRDMCLRKCVEEGFLSHIECTESGIVHRLPPFSTEIKKLRRCALMGEDEVDEKWQFGEKAIGLRSLLVFNKRFTPGREIWKSCPLLRLLDLEGTRGYCRLYGMKCLIHLRYVSLRGSSLEEIPSCLLDLHYVETLDLRGEYDQMKPFQNSTFYKMKRLRHLYLPPYFRVKGGKKLKFPIEGQMETIKNFDPESCETEDLMQMTNLRVFSIRRGYYFKKAEELKWVLEAPVIKKARQLINNLRLEIDGDVTKEDPAILSPVEGHPSFKRLSIRGKGECVKKEGNNIIFSNSLTWVALDECAAIGDVLLDLEMLPCLKSLSVVGGQDDNKLLSFSVDSFPQLTELILRGEMEWEEWEVRKGAIANLQSLKLGGWRKLKKVVMNEIPESLTQVELQDCEIGEGGASLLCCLERLPRLQKLTIEGGGNKLSFSHGSFPRLTELILSGQTKLEEWEVGEGALPTLQRLKLIRCEKLKKLPEGLPDSVDIECEDPCIKGIEKYNTCPHFKKK